MSTGDKSWIFICDHKATRDFESPWVKALSSLNLSCEPIPESPVISLAKFEELDKPSVFILHAEEKREEQWAKVLEEAEKVQRVIVVSNNGDAAKKNIKGSKFRTYKYKPDEIRAQNVAGKELKSLITTGKHLPPDEKKKEIDHTHLMNSIKIMLAPWQFSSDFNASNEITNLIKEMKDRVKCRDYWTQEVLDEMKNSKEEKVRELREVINADESADKDDEFWKEILDSLPIKAA